VPLSLEQWVKIIIISASVLILGVILRVSFRYLDTGKNQLPA
jgi:hypothetical protein